MAISEFREAQFQMIFGPFDQIEDPVITKYNLGMENINLYKFVKKLL